MYIEYLNFKNALQNRGKSNYEKFLSKYDSKKLPREFTSFLIPSPFLIEKYTTIDDLDKKEYAKKRKYDHHPILEVSKKEAIDFCTWRTAMVNFHFRNINDLRIVNYRLASKEELENAKSKFINYSMVQHSGKITQIKKQKIAENFTIFPINELTASEQYFNDDEEYKWNGFRCMCEVQTID